MKISKSRFWIWGFIILLFVLVSVSCGQKKIFQEHWPESQDGVYFLEMNHIGEDDLLKGEWSAPVLGDNKLFHRFLMESGAAMTFYLPQKEDILVDIKFIGEPESFGIKVNDLSIPVSGLHLRRKISADHTKAGENDLQFLFSGQDMIGIESIHIYPTRYLRMEDTFDRQTDCLTPGRLILFLNPGHSTELRLALDLPGKNKITASITLQSDTKTNTYEKTIKKGRSFSIVPLDSSFHKITIDIPETKAGFITVLESSLIKPHKPPASLKKLRSAVKEKNILFLLLDAARPDRFGCYGYDRDTTGFIDEMAETSYLFSDAASEAVYTLASTGTLLTGLPPDFHGVVSAFVNTLNDQIETFPELLKKRGYFTAAISSNPYFGPRYNYHQGFDHFVELFHKKDAVRADEFIEPFRGLVKQKKDKPFFIYAHIREPHSPYAMPPPFFGSYQQEYIKPSPEFYDRVNRIARGIIENPEDLTLISDVYDENLAFADHIVGLLFDILKHSGLWEETVIIVLSDHGEALGEQGLVGHNSILYQETVRIPLLIRIPGVLNHTKVLDHPVLTSDIVVTLCDLLGLEYPYTAQTRGRNLFVPSPQRTRICRFMDQTSGYAGYSLLSHPYKLIFFPEIGPWDFKLFNLMNDPDEKNHLQELDLIDDALWFEFRNFIHSASHGIPSGQKPKLTKEEIEALKTLGYIKE